MVREKKKGKRTMNTILSLLTDDNIEKIVVKRQDITNTKLSENQKLVNLNLQICVEYASQKSEKSVTVSDYINKWLNDVKVNDLKPSSFDRKEQTIKYQVLPYIGNISIYDLTSDDVQNMINDLKASSYSYSTIKKAYECINSCLKYAVKRRDLAFNVAESVIIPKNLKREKSDIECFSDDEVRSIEEEAVKCYKNGKRIYRMGEIVIFLVNTGLRIGEALALEWADIDFKTRKAHIRKNMVYVKDRSSSEKSYQYVKQRSTKTKNGSRIIPLNAAAIRTLMSLKSINGSAKYVFATSKGKRVFPRNIDRMFRSILKNCGLKSVGVHTLRHTFASRLFAKGVDVKTVSELLGHSEVGITYDTYIHLIQEQQAAAVDILENVL